MLIWSWSLCTKKLWHAVSESDGVVLCLQGQPGPVGEDIARRGGGHRAQPALWFRPSQGGQLTTKVVAGPPKEYNLNPAMDLVLCRGKNPHPVLTGDGSAKGDLTLKNTQLPHWVTEVSTLTVSPIPQTDKQPMGRDFNPSPYIHSAWEFIW